jgi:hypothetical protein
LFGIKLSVLALPLTAFGLIQGVLNADQVQGSSPGEAFTSFNAPMLPLYASDSTSGPSAAPAPDGPYGWFNLLDSRSEFGSGFFPEPFLVDEGDRDREVAFSWFHQEGFGSITDQITGEIEWTFGDTTIEVEAPYETDTSPGTNDFTGLPDTERTSGMDSPQVAVRHPVWQYLSPDNNIDNTLVAGFEVAIPSNSPVGKDTELVPEIFDLLRIGDHLGIQTHVGYSTLLGSETPNKQTLEYSLDVSYQIDDSLVHLPDPLLAIVPIFELAGERGLNNGDLSNNLTGVIGARLNLAPIGRAAPRIGIGYVFPVDHQASQDFRWGVITSIVFDL